jgi:hypothetical protein
MNTFSRTNLRRRNKRDKRNVFRALFLFILFAFVNLVFNVFIDPGKNYITLIVGLALPFFYSIFYFYSKRIKYRYRIQTNSAILTPVFYLSFGLLWFVMITGILSLTSIKIESKPDKRSKKQNQSQQIETQTSVENHEHSLSDKTTSFFLYEENLFRMASIPNLIIKSNCKNKRSDKTGFDCEHFFKSTTNKTITFVVLFISQIILIFISENIIYPLLKNKVNPSTSSKTQQ